MPGASASAASEVPYWYVMSGGSPPCSATVSFWYALSLVPTYFASTWTSGCVALNASTRSLSDFAS